MQVNKLGIGPLSIPMFGSKGQQGGSQPADPLLAKLGGGDSSAINPTASAREILSNYDVTNITPREFSQLMNDLHSSGTITDAELQELSSIRFELDKQQIGPDEKVNLVDLFQKKLGQQTEESQAAATDRADSQQTPEQRDQAQTVTQRQVEWLQKFSTLHEEASAESLNTLA